MTAFDFAVLGILFFSFLLGMWRGVIGELLALAGWVVAYFSARTFAPDVSSNLTKLLPDATLRYVAAFAVVFVGVLLLFALGRLLARMLMDAVGLSTTDHLLGAIFGLGRGVLIALLGVMLGGMTALPKEAWWREAQLAPPLETAVIAAKPWLPAEVSKRVRYR